MLNVSAAPPVTRSGINPGTGYRPALITLAVLYFMLGFITCLNDSLIPFFKKGFSLTYTQSSFVQLYFFLTYGIMSIPAGRLVGKIGHKNGIVTGFGLAAVGAVLFLPAAAFHVYEIFLAALFVLAIGIVILQVAANPYITSLGRPETASSRFNLIQAMGSLGTTVAPIVGAYFILSKIHFATVSSEALKIPYLVISLILVLIAVIVRKLPLAKIQHEAETGAGFSGEERSVFAYRNLRFGIPAIFMYVGAEVAIGSFLTNYVADTLSIDLAAANRYVAFYWGGMLAGRFLGGALLRILSTRKILNACALSAIACIIVSLRSDGHLAADAMVLTGFFNSIMFASIFSLSVEGMGSSATKASGLLSTAIIGGAVFPFLVGIIRDRSSWTIAFLLPVIAYLYIAFYAVNGSHPSRKQKPV